jgi:hypothetical protein
MTLRAHFTVIALIVLGVATGLAACGGDDDSCAPAPAAQTMTGHAMSAGASTGSVTSAAADLRVTLDTLLGEHALLAIAATQKGYDGDPDFEAAAAALDANSVDVANAIGSVYGDEAADTFLNGPSLWRDHISFFVDYTVALAKKDTAAQKEAVDNLIGYTGAFSGFLAQATGLPQAPLQEGVTEHVMQLKGALDAYAAGNYEKVARLTREAYAHMVMTGDTLTDAIVAQRPEMLGG